ncbi:hypothetical protein D3C72_1385870 [compost metagenome]
MLDRSSQHPRQIAFPCSDIGFGTGHSDALAISGYRQYAVTLSEGCGHQFGGGGKIKLQWIDMQIGQSGVLSQPLA